MSTHIHAESKTRHVGHGKDYLSLSAIYFIDAEFCFCDAPRNVKRENADKAMGKRLKALREAKGIRQNFVAEKLGLSNNFLSELESGKRRWYAAVVYKYERIVNP